MSERSIEDFDEDISEEEPPYREVKSRRLNAKPSKGKDVESDSHYSSASSPGKKPKSKHKIHIPRNAELPRDAFFTQPPRRSSSPYRIDEFHWRKPHRRSPTQLTARGEVRRGDIHVAPAPPQPINSNGVSRRTPSASPDAPDYDSTYDGDHLFDELLEDIGDEALFFQNTVGRPGPSLKNVQITNSSQLEPIQCLRAPLSNLKQTTLFGTQAQGHLGEAQPNRKHNWPLANRDEVPTHHKLDPNALKTWVYPTNLGAIRDYQYSIVAKGLYHNMLVALPTGLGKTFIAATIMLNWFRWTSEAQIVFVAPTKPLVSQQIKACFDIAGIPRSSTCMLTGSTAPGLRAEEWNSKRVFFMTPQTIVNDLKSGICDPKRLVLLVIDEAHRATGNYAYVEVVRFVRRFNSSFRVLALTATPGSSIETVQEVIDGLGIARVEIRTEESIDIRQYVHPRKIDTILFDNSEEMIMIMELFSKALQPLVNMLAGMNAYWSRDPMSLTPYGCNQARQRWMSDAGKRASRVEVGMVNRIFSILASLSHGTDLLKFHGIAPFYYKMLAFRNEIHIDVKKGSKYARQINDNEAFQTMMSRIQIWINTADFIGHPKLEYLQDVVMNHFLDAGEGRGVSAPSGTRIMVFAHYRDSAEEIARILKRNEPMVRSHVFVGQATSRGSEGMDQKKQLDIIQRFKDGIYNTLIATSIGEEGLDIGEVDLIVCYDASASPIRMLQRMGRTGRKRAGKIVVTLMKGKEETNFLKAKDNYEKMQLEIASGARFNFRDDQSQRIIPKGTQPVVDKRVIEVPPENTQTDLPEPTKKGRTRIPKRPPKKFHMPDGVRTGFTKASRIDHDEASDDGEVIHATRKQRGKQEISQVQSYIPVPSLEEVLLRPNEERLFEKKYLDIRSDEPQLVEPPRLDTFPRCQRTQQYTKHVTHGALAKRTVNMLRVMHRMTEDPSGRFEEHLLPEDRSAGKAQAGKRARFFDTPFGTSAIMNTSQGEHLSIQTLHGAPVTKLLRPKYSEQGFDVSSSEGANPTEDGSTFAGDLRRGSATLSSGSPPTKIEIEEVDEASADELPDFHSLVRRENVCKIPEQGKRHAKRRIVHDSSDDE